MTLMTLCEFYCSCKPWVFNDLCCGKSFNWISSQHFSNEILCHIRYHHPDRFLELQRRVHHICENFLILFALKRRLTWQQNKQNDSQGPHITFFVIQLFKNLGCDVVGLKVTIKFYCSYSLSWLKLTGLEMDGTSEINYF